MEISLQFTDICLHSHSLSNFTHSFSASTWELPSSRFAWHSELGHCDLHQCLGTVSCKTTEGVGKILLSFLLLWCFWCCYLKLASLLFCVSVLLDAVICKKMFGGQLLSETLRIGFQIGGTVLAVLSGSLNSDPSFFSTDHALTILSLKCWPLSLKANCVAIRGPCMSCLLRESHIVAYGSCMVTADQPLQAYSPSKIFSGCICIHINKQSPETHNLFLHSSHCRDFCRWDPWITSQVILCYLLLHVYSGCRRPQAIPSM